MKPPIEFRAKNARVVLGREASVSATRPSNGKGSNKRKAVTGPAKGDSQKSDPTDATSSKPLCSVCGLEDGACICAHLGGKSKEDKLAALIRIMEAKRVSHNAYHKQYRADLKQAKAAGLTVKQWREKQ